MNIENNNNVSQYKLPQIADLFFKTNKSENLVDFFNKSNYIASSIIESESFSFEMLDELNQNWDILKGQKEQDFLGFFNENISDEDLTLAMDSAIIALEERQKENLENFPEYGDCKDYYNYGSVLDWILTHPVAMGFEALTETVLENKDAWYSKLVGVDIAEKYQNLYHNIMGKDGVFTAVNIPAYIFDTDDEIRQDDFADFMQIRSTETIKEDISSQHEIIEAMKLAKDNPEEFARLYYLITNGVNFNPEKILDYMQNLDSDYGEVELYGRDYINEDIAKNRLGTDAIFEANKLIGSTLFKLFGPAGAPAAWAVNSGLTILDNETQGENEEKKTNEEIIINEAANAFILHGSAKISSKIVANLPVCNQLKNIIKVGAYSMIATNTKNTADMLVKHSQNAPLEDYAPNTVDLLTQWKAQLGGLFKLPFVFFNFGK